MPLSVETPRIQDTKFSIHSVTYFLDAVDGGGISPDVVVSVQELFSLAQSCAMAGDFEGKKIFTKSSPIIRWRKKMIRQE